MERNSQTATLEKAGWSEALERIDQLRKDSSYIEDVYFASGRWADEITAAKNRVPEELRHKARMFAIELALERGESIAPELSRYKQDVEAVMVNFKNFIAGQTTEQILSKILSVYEESLKSDPDYASHLADLFLGEAEQKAAREKNLNEAVEAFYSVTDREKKFKAAEKILDYWEYGVTPEDIRLALDFVILNQELDKYAFNHIQLRNIVRLLEQNKFEVSPVVYRHVNPMIRDDINRAIHSHDKRQELLALADKYEKLGLLHLEREDADLFEQLTDKTYYERERDAVCEKIDARLKELPLKKYGLEKGKEVSLAAIADFVNSNLEMIDQGVRQNFYWHIRRSMYMTDRYGFLIGKDDWNNERGRVEIDLDNETKLILEYRPVSKEAYDKNINNSNRFDRMYLSEDDFVFDSAHFRTVEKSLRHAKTKLTDAPNDRMVKADKVINWLRVILEPAPDCGRALEDLRKLSAEKKIDEATYKKIATAIQEYAAFSKAPPLTDYDCFGEVGRCLVVPSNFETFCRNKFGVDMKTAKYGDGVNFYHEVNTFGKIVIDWTARQYPKFRDRPYPFIYARDKAAKITGFGELVSFWHDDQLEYENSEKAA